VSSLGFDEGNTVFPSIRQYRRKPVSTVSVGPGFRREYEMTKPRRAALLPIAVIAALSFAPAAYAEPQHCVRAGIVLWGDGRHDDSAALNAWFGGEAAIWAESGEAVGASIAGRSFRLSAPLYVRGGTGRRLEEFRMLWPERGEIVSGGSIESGSDPDQAPIVSGVEIKGGDPGEGAPFDAPDAAPAGRDERASCAIS
jgi:hypothetical protein